MNEITLEHGVIQPIFVGCQLISFQVAHSPQADRFSYRSSAVAERPRDCVFLKCVIASTDTQYNISRALLVSYAYY